LLAVSFHQSSTNIKSHLKKEPRQAKEHMQTTDGEAHRGHQWATQTACPTMRTGSCEGWKNMNTEEDAYLLTMSRNQGVTGSPWASGCMTGDMDTAHDTEEQ
jgi:hypothetical protein